MGVLGIGIGGGLVGKMGEYFRSREGMVEFLLVDVL